MARAQCSKEQAIHHGREPEPNLALGPNLARERCASQNAVVGMRPQAFPACILGHLPRVLVAQGGGILTGYGGLLALHGTLRSYEGAATGQSGSLRCRNLLLLLVRLPG